MDCPLNVGVDVHAGGVKKLRSEKLRTDGPKIALPK